MPRALFAAAIVALMLVPAAASAQTFDWHSANGKSPSDTADLLGPDGSPVPFKAYRVLMHVTSDDVMDPTSDEVVFGFGATEKFLASVPDGGYMLTNIGVNWSGGSVNGHKVFSSI